MQVIKKRVLNEPLAKGSRDVSAQLHQGSKKSDIFLIIF